MTLKSRIEKLESQVPENPTKIFFQREDRSIYDIEHNFHFPDEELFNDYMDEHFDGVDIILFSPFADKVREDIPEFLKPSFNGY